MVAKNSTGVPCKINTVNPVKAFPGNVSTSTAAAFAASYLQEVVPQPPAPLPPAGMSFSVGATINDEVGSFNLISTWTNLGSGEFEYSYEVDSSLSSPLAFSWAPAGISGSVSSGSPFVMSFTSDIPGVEIDDIASYSLPDFARAVLAPAFVPAPEPPSGVVLSTFAMVAIVLDVLRRSRRKRRKA
jgi:hypothetical protein